MLKTNPVLNSVKARLWRNNQNWIAGIVGSPGTGKSWAALEIADYIEAGKFDIKRVFFRIEDLLKAIDNEEIKKGDCVILDEAGVSWGSRAFMKKISQDMSHLFQVMRFMNFALIMTVPSLDFIDKHGRSLVNMVFMTKGIDRKNKTAKLEMLHYSYNPITGKPYPKNPRIVIDGKRYRVRIMHCSKPRQKLITKYEAYKKRYVTWLISEKVKIQEKEQEKAHAKEGKPAKCNKCGHEWLTKSKARTPGCPSCGGRSTTTNL